MTKIKLTIPEQHFILEGKTLQEARDSFDAANIDFEDEVLCDTCEKSEDADGRCSCTNKDAHGV